MKPQASLIAELYRSSCLDELRAPKAGNVHDFSAGHGMTVSDFEVSANVTAPFVARAGAPVGERILGAIRATRAAVGCNTNLGIVLMSAPLAAAAERADGPSLRESVGRILAGLDVADATAVFEAIVLASPAGLGRSDAHDVRAPATVRLIEAMRTAAERDRIAWNYSNGFADVFEIGLPTYRAAMERFGDHLWATAAVHFAMMAAFPDTHIAREHGADAAARAQESARRIADELGSADEPRTLLPRILTLDGELKTAGVNPGTSADLTVATLFAERLERLESDARA
ncbi:triphosphoribosyl-dephospho-CoA synthase [Faunimonas sp. B44]|uniref:triphosphoribosyl-dephospho-CoA synthase n=1 Tax=Faunimonas sp. B44 TaxID=3461493 RepID=UPI004044F0B2